MAEPSVTGGYCVLSYGYTTWKRLGISVLQCLFPTINFGFFIFCYWRVEAITMRAVPNLRLSAKTLGEIKQVTRYMHSLCLIFLITWAPSNVAMWFRFAVNDKIRIPMVISVFLETLILLNSLLNPVFYFILFPDYRYALIRLVTCKWPCLKRKKKKKLKKARRRRRRFASKNAIELSIPKDIGSEKRRKIEEYIARG
eukprot:209225_1